MNKLRYLTIILIFVNLIAFSQSKKLSYYDLEIGRYYNLRPNTIQSLQWLDAENICSIENDTLFKMNSKTPLNKEILFTLNEINSQVSGLKIDSLKTFPRRYVVENPGVISFQTANHILKYDLKSKSLKIALTLPKGAENTEYFNGFKKAVYGLENGFFLQQKDEKQIEINKSDKKGITFGSVVHRNEFGIENGSYWSPKGNKVAYYLKDESMVSPYPIVRIDSRVAKLDEIYYPMAGMKSEEVQLLVFDLESGSNIELKTGGDPEQYLTNVAWSNDSKYIYIQQLNRGQNHMYLVKYNAENGEVADTLFEEVHEKYVEPLNPVVFSNNQDGDFYYQSKRDGFNHIYYYDSKKGKLSQITKGEWEVTDFIGYDTNEEFIYFMATKESPLERHLYKASLKNHKIVQLTSEPGVHRVNVNSDYSQFIDRYSSTSTPNKIQIKNIEGKKLSELLVAENPLAEYKLGEVENGTFTGGDNKTWLHYRIVKPVDFDPDKKYPVIFYIYGGPHAQMVTNSWVGRTELWFQYMAQQGFIGITIDTRGSSARGMEFENVIHRQTGIPQMEDIMKGVEFLAGKSYVDTSRIGIHGWSYGGYMTISMLTQHSDVFKVGVAGGPVVDWKYYEVMYGERYMDTPEENPEGYELTNLSNYAGNLKGKLKIIHGSVDPTVVWQHSQSFVQSCIKAGTFPDYFFYPLHEHNVRGYDRVHLIELISKYFIENL